MVDKEGKSKPNIVEEAITSPISAENKFYTVNKTEKLQASNKTVDTPKTNKTDTVKSLDKSRSTQRTDTENTVDKSKSIPRSNYSNKSARIEKPSEIHISQKQFKCFWFLWTTRKFIKCKTRYSSYSSQ